jgi:choline transporter-like protein 2/4/5
MAVDTLFLCFLEDMERNDGTPEKPYFMSRGLQKIVGKMQKFNVEKEQHKLDHMKRMERRNKYGT